MSLEQPLAPWLVLHTREGWDGDYVFCVLCNKWVDDLDPGKRGEEDDGFHGFPIGENTKDTALLRAPVHHMCLFVRSLFGGTASAVVIKSWCTLGNPNPYPHRSTPKS